MRLALLTATAFVATVFAANYSLQRWGLVPVGLGLVAPAGVYFAGLAFFLRDLTQRLGGRRLVLAAILVGAAASYTVSARYATASAAAFLLSEVADYAVYTPLVDRHLLGAVAASNLIGAALDSAVFLLLAFGTLDFFAGQFVGKAWVTAACLPLVWASRRWWVPTPA